MSAGSTGLVAVAVTVPVLARRALKVRSSIVGVMRIGPKPEARQWRPAYSLYGLDFW